MNNLKVHLLTIRLLPQHISLIYAHNKAAIASALLQDTCICQNLKIGFLHALKLNLFHKTVSECRPAVSQQDSRLGEIFLDI
jgi:hypothetical protein